MREDGTSPVNSLSFSCRSNKAVLFDKSGMRPVKKYLGGNSGTTSSSGVGDAPTRSPNAPSGDFQLSRAWIAHIVLIVVFIVAVFVLVFCMCHTKNWHWTLGKVKNLENEKEVGPRFEGQHVTLSIEFFRQVTKYFTEENILGRGGFGVVYRGELDNGTKIAVKRMKCDFCRMGSQGMNELEAKIAILSKVTPVPHFTL
ncbi:Receptor-like kinase [Vigna angularis]|uniref:Receptor-like kinase n=2 Tax=Phaseolus angularis TaxID=3914 RepID=A0A8T0L9I9_PHAAN|nr:Receptor-like kinase [Vigna angularis]BAT86639.1 hypothetical protein VIGAN_04431200 [Vigna angularis var. angularis]